MYILITLQISSKLSESLFSSPQTRLKIKQTRNIENPTSSNFSFRTFHIEFLLNISESLFNLPQTRLKIKRNTQNPNPISSILLFSHRPFRSSNKQTNQRPLPNQLEKQIPDISRRIESREGGGGVNRYSREGISQKAGHYAEQGV